MRIDRKILANPSKATTARSVYVAASSLSILAILERTKSQAESVEYAKRYRQRDVCPSVLCPTVSAAAMTPIIIHSFIRLLIHTANTL